MVEREKDVRGLKDEKEKEEREEKEMYLKIMYLMLMILLKNRWKMVFLSKCRIFLKIVWD